MNEPIGTLCFVTISEYDIPFVTYVAHRIPRNEAKVIALREMLTTGHCQCLFLLKDGTLELWHRSELNA